MALKKAKSTMNPFLVFEESFEIQREFARSLFWKNAVSQALREHRIVASVPHREVKVKINLERMLPLTAPTTSDRVW